MTDRVRDVIHQNLQRIQQQIDAACQGADRIPTDVRLIAVTKYARWEWLDALTGLHAVCGENRPQQLAERHTRLPNVEWHLIGQLQRNKVRLALEHATLIHSVDSIRLLERINAVAKELNIVAQVLLQVNVSGEASKSGFSVDELRGCWRKIAETVENVQVNGLMTMAAESDDPEQARPVFRSLRELRDELTGDSEMRDGRQQLTELSMGMSGDLVPAVEEGATLVRVGTRIFAGLE